MKILQVISNLGNGGAEKFVVELSNELSKKNEVVLYCFKKIQPWMQFPKLLSNSVPLISLNKNKGFDLATYWKLYKVFKTQKPDAVHFHLDSTIKYILPFVILFPNVNFIHTLHSDLTAKKRKIFTRLCRYKYFMRRIKLVCISKNITEDFQKQFPGVKFHLVENGVSQPFPSQELIATRNEVESLKINEQTLIFTSVGRLDSNKNQKMLMNVFAELKTFNVIGLIIGNDPSLNKNYLNEIQQIKPGNVFILGAKANVIDYLTCSHALIMSSLHEGMPISILEAFSVGLPVISTPAGGICDLVVNHRNGFLSKGFTTEEMVITVKRFINLIDVEKEEIRKTNKENFKTLYDIAYCAEKYSALYN